MKLVRLYLDIKMEMSLLGSLPSPANIKHGDKLDGPQSSAHSEECCDEVFTRSKKFCQQTSYEAGHSAGSDKCWHAAGNKQSR
jgi:hypothetical protein